MAKQYMGLIEGFGALPLLLSFLLMITAGCASVKVQKIPYPPDYYEVTQNSSDPQKTAWNQKQEEADKIKGVRYYLPRPYMAVKQEYPISGATFIVSGTVKDNSITIDKENVPDEYKHLFSANAIPFAQIKDLTGTRAVEMGTQRQSEDASGKEYEKKYDLVIDKDNLSLSIPTTNYIKDKAVVSPEGIVTLQATVKPGALTNRNADLQAEMFLLPMSNGKANVVEKTAFTDVAVTTPKDPAKDDTVLAGHVNTKTIPAFSSLAVTLKKKDGSGYILFCTGQIDLLNQYASYSSAPAKMPPKGAENTTSTESTQTYSSANVKASGSVPAVVTIGKLYDVILLPDDSQQYAIEAKGRLGMAKMDITLGHGWYLDHFLTEIDNRKTGEFIYSNLSKVIDLGIAAVAPEAAVAKSMAGAASVAESPQVEAQAAKATKANLKVAVVEYAVPGLYPIASIKELLRGKTTAKLEADRPIVPKVIYRTRQDIEIGLLSFSPKTATPSKAAEIQIIRSK